MDRNFGAVAGLAGQCLDLDNAFGYFRHFQVEHRPNEVGVRSRKNDFDHTGLLAHIQHHRPDAFFGHVRFAGDLLAAGQQSVGAPKLHYQRAAFPAGRATGDDLAATIEVFLVDTSAFGLANSLDHHLFGGLGCDSPQFPDADRLAFDLRGDLAGLAVEPHDDIFGRRVGFAEGRVHRRFEIFKDRLGVDVLIPGNAVYYTQ